MGGPQPGVGGVDWAALEDQTDALLASLLRPRERVCSTGRTADVGIVAVFNMVGIAAAGPELCIRPAVQLGHLYVPVLPARVACEAINVVQHGRLQDCCVLAEVREQAQR